MKCITNNHILYNFRINVAMKKSVLLQAMTRGAEEQIQKGRVIYKMQGNYISILYVFERD